MWDKLINISKQLLEETRSEYRKRVQALGAFAVEVREASGESTFLIKFLNYLKPLLFLRTLRSVISSVFLRHLLESKYGQYTLGFLKRYRVFLMLSIIVITFFIEILLVQKRAATYIILLVLISLVNLYICERKVKENSEDLRYYNFMFFFINWLWIIIFFYGEFIEFIQGLR